LLKADRREGAVVRTVGGGGLRQGDSAWAYGSSLSSTI
jgi:hypothetical protein